MRSIYPILSAILFLQVTAHAATNIGYSIVKWGKVNAHVVTVNLNSSDVKVSPALARNGPGSSETFGSMVKRIQPSAAITGTFFCTRSLLPTGDIVIDGRLVHKGSVGTGVCFTSHNTVEFVPLKKGHTARWDEYDSVLCAGPTLVRDGRIYLIPRDEGFTDPGIYAMKTRTALGVTDKNKLLLVTVNSPISLRTLAKIMVHIGAVDAVDLDGGSSTAMYKNGKFITNPGRKLTNVLVAYDNLTSYFKHRYSLAPGMGITTVAKEPSTTAQLNNPVPLSVTERSDTYRDNLTLITKYRIQSTVNSQSYITPAH